MALPHARLEGGAVEGARVTACKSGGDLCLYPGNRSCALLVLSDQVTDIITRIAEASVMGSALDPILHGSGSDTFIVAIVLSSRLPGSLPKVTRFAKGNDKDCHNSGLAQAKARHCTVRVSEARTGFPGHLKVV